MRIKTLDIGVERITLWDVEDETHLPLEGKSAPLFLPQAQALDAILKRPSLDERLPDLLQPASIDPDLLEPTALSDARAASRAFFERRAAAEPDRARRSKLLAAAETLGDDERLDADVRMALAMLLRG